MRTRSQMPRSSRIALLMMMMSMTMKAMEVKKPKTRTMMMMMMTRRARASQNPRKRARARPRLAKQSHPQLPTEVKSDLVRTAKAASAESPMLTSLSRMRPKRAQMTMWMATESTI